MYELFINGEFHRTMECLTGPHGMLAHIEFMMEEEQLNDLLSIEIRKTN